MAAGSALDDPRDRAARARAGLVSLVAGTAIFAGKLVAWYITGSSAVLSDALESVVNVAAAALLVWSLRLAARPADRNHPYGHGKVEFFSAGVEGTLIALAATLILIEALRQLAVGPELRRLEGGILLVSLAAAANAALGLYLVRVGRRTHSLALVADGRHILTDVATSVGVILALAAVWLTGWVLLDPLIAILVALNILYTGWRLVRQAVAGLMDEADEVLLGRVAAELEECRAPWWIDVHSLRAWRSGAVWHADLHLVVPRYFDADRLHGIHHGVARAIHGASGMPGDTIVHFDPCRPRHCPSCAMPDCPVRSAPVARRLPISLERATRGDESLETGIPLAPEAAR